MNTCYAMVLEKQDFFVKKQFPIPEVDADSLLLKVEMVSICGSDRKHVKGTHTKSSFPKILGHEVVGFVVKAGENAKRLYDVKEGDRIIVEPYVGCRSCEYCLTGNYQSHNPMICYGTTGFDWTQPPYLFGAYSEYLYVVKGSKVFKIGSDVPAEAACLSSVLANGIRWVRTRGKVKYGESVVIIGPGSQGLASVIAAKESGAYPIIVAGLSKDSYKFEVAKKLGADFIIDLEQEDIVARVNELTGGKMADAVIECAGAAPAMAMTLLLARDCGRIVLAGLTGGQKAQFHVDHIVNNELAVFGGHGQSWDVEDSCRIINSRKYPVEDIITHRYPLERVDEAMKLFFEAPPECIRVGLVP